MGIYLNPGNSGFERITNNAYVDKTGLIGFINNTIDTTKNLICISRPRRFGKSFAAQMLCAYYDRSCDSRALFSGYKVSKDESYEKHINKYHVINLDISSFISEAQKEEIPLREVPKRISEMIKKDLESIYPDIAGAETLNEELISLVDHTNTKIVFIIDEWD